MDQRMGGRDYSLDEEIRPEEKQTKIDFIASGSGNQEQIVIQNQQTKELKSSLKEAMEALNERETYIINNRLLSDKQMTLEKLGEKFKISRERIRQIEKSAIKKIKKILVKNGITADF
jgi:RNA polymerase sigma-32 factor